jgi:two-component system NtrC family sensor kinase
LGGARVDEMCNEIAAAITEVSNFRGAAIQLEAADHTWRVAGSSGMSESWLANLQCRAKQLITGSIHDICSEARRVGRNSFLLPDHSAGNSASGWNPGDQMLIPLRSARGADLGCITLVDPRREAAVNPSELARIELLAADLAVAIELKSLHRQLVRSEKLAALGQLVAGVAHELNNPLTAVMGYGELVGDEVSSPSAREHSIKMVSEARRMKKIVDNLLRFSRQSPVDKLSVQASGVVQEVLALREYYMRTRNVQVDLDVKPNLWLAIDEDEIKQILLNLLNNSIDAMETTPGRKRIGIRAYQTNSRAVIEVEDTGTGFTHLNRALDPFYTTKPVGKGTGLGLSICYGIVKDHGGEVRLENLEPNGARVTIELPIAEAERPAPALAAAVGAPA